MSEVLYRVFYSENTQGLYTIDSVTIEFMLESKLTLEEKYCESGNTDTYLLNQKYGIDFMVTREGMTGDQYTLQTIADSEEITRSGNPGYQLNQPLIVAESQNEAKGKKVGVLGYYIEGPSTSGQCLAVGASSGGPAQRLDYGK